MRKNWPLPLRGHRVQQRNGFALIVIEPRNRLPVCFYEELAEVEVARQESELFHGELSAREALRKIRAGQAILCELLDVGLAHDLLLHRIMLGEPGIFARKLKYLIHRTEQLL